jgi:GH15 family glucan-1,4-alpha-glucosidase
MTVQGGDHANKLVRQVKAIRGEIGLTLCFDPRFDYGRAAHTVTLGDHDALFASSGSNPTAVRFRATLPFQIKDGMAVAEFVLQSGQTASFVMEAAHAGERTRTLAESDVARWFKETVGFWRRWIGRSKYRGRWREMINRSALSLKLLVSDKHGSLVAAPTFGLPETVGGSRNWDYRFTWIRDASFTLYALMRLGYSDEAAAFMSWIDKRCQDLNPDGSLQALYGLDGRKHVPETILTHFEGYRKSSPVRIGNDAANQIQLDIYGELMDSVYLFNKFGQSITYEFWTNLVRLINYVCDHWHLPDEGVWEVRGGRREFLCSRVMCWVAVDRGIRLAEKRPFPAPLDRWRKVRHDIHKDVTNNFWNSELQSYVQYKGARAVDASALLMPLVRFIGPQEQRWFFTLGRIEQELVQDSLVHRYNLDQAAPDGLTGAEGTFTLCSFNYVECLAIGRDLDKARYVFEKALGYANHVGLYAEELGPCGEHLGNFPQAFTHLALISAAWKLDHELGQ